MAELFLIFIGACLVNNLILDTMLGIDPALALSKKVRVAIGMGLTMALTAPVAVLLTYIFKVFVLIPAGLDYLDLICFVLIISIGITCIQSYLQKAFPQLYKRIATFIPLLHVNSALLGVVLLNFQAQHSLLATLFFGIGSGTGFAIVITAFAAMHERIAVADIPMPFRGAAILLITLGLMSMAFMGFTGMVKL